MGEKGLYFAAREAEKIGFSIALVYIPQEKGVLSFICTSTGGRYEVTGIFDRI